MKLCLTGAIQLQVGENYSYLFILRPKHLQIWIPEDPFRFEYQWFYRLIKQTKNDYSGSALMTSIIFDSWPSIVMAHTMC